MVYCSGVFTGIQSMKLLFQGQVGSNLQPQLRRRQVSVFSDLLRFPMMCHVSIIYACDRAPTIACRSLDYPVVSPRNPPQFDLLTSASYHKPVGPHQRQWVESISWLSFDYSNR
jgi:hypothetical protein